MFFSIFFFGWNFGLGEVVVVVVVVGGGVFFVVVGVGVGVGILFVGIAVGKGAVIDGVVVADVVVFVKPFVTIAVGLFVKVGGTLVCRRLSVRFRMFTIAKPQ